MANAVTSQELIRRVLMSNPLNWIARMEKLLEIHFQTSTWWYKTFSGYVACCRHHISLIILFPQPAIESEESFGKCPEENWKEYSGTVSKFAEMLTEAVHSLKGGIELPMPDSKYETVMLSLRLDLSD